MPNADYNGIIKHAKNTIAFCQVISMYPGDLSQSVAEYNPQLIHF